MRKTVIAALLAAAWLMLGSSAFAGEIHEAVKKNDIARVKALVEQNPRLVNERERMRMTPLHYAACFGHVQLVTFLISKGADLNARDVSWGFTPLHLAINRETASALLSHGAQIDARDNYGGTPLFAAVSNGRKDVVSFLLSQGADVNARTSYKMTPTRKAILLFNDPGTRKDVRNAAGEIIVLLKKQGGKE